MELIRAIQGAFAPQFDQFMLLVTQLGSPLAYIAFLVITYLSIDARTGRRIGFFFLLGFFLNQHLKGLFDTDRPFVHAPEVARSEAAVATALGPGFPSGHAQGSTTFWGLAALYAKRRLFTLVAVAIIFIVSFSRLYLGVHWPLDVFGGILIGLGVVYVAAATSDLLEAPPRWLVIGGGLLVPFGLHLALPTADSALILGGFAAIASGPAIVRHRVGGALWSRALLSALGLLLVIAYLFGSSALLPEQVKDHPVGGFVRYLILGYLGIVVAPLLGRVLKIAPGSEVENV
jgi:hypothetical protein